MALAENRTDDAVVSFNIPQQRADFALTEFASQAGRSFIFPFDAARAITANRLVGKFQIVEGLQRLLIGTGLKIKVGDQGQLSVSSTTQRIGEIETVKKPQSGTAKFLAAVLSIFSVTGAQSQNLAEDSVPLIEEIVVTASKREVSLQETSLSISALTEFELGRQGIENYEDFARQVPGVILTGSKNFQKFTIRGISTNSTSASNGEQKPVAVYINEIPVSTFNIVTPDVRLFDVQRVEVLRGPQGTAFGSGSMAGSVRIITNGPDVEEFDAAVRVDVGSISGGGVRQRYSGMANLPLIEDELALRVVGYARDEEGYVDNIGSYGFPGEKNGSTSKEWGIRASVLWEPTDQLSATLSVMHDDIESEGSELSNPAINDKRATFFSEFSRVESTNVNATLEYSLPWAQLVSSTSYARAETDWAVDLDGVLTGLLPLGFGALAEQDAFVQELRLVSTIEGNIEWLGGLFYLERESKVTQATFTSQAFLDQLGVDVSGLFQVPAPGAIIGDGVRKPFNREAAVFGELTYHISDRLSVTAGLRHTRYKFSDKTDGGHRSNAIPLIFGALFGAGGGVATSIPTNQLSGTTGNESVTTTRLSLDWQARENMHLYFTAAEGFRRAHPNIAANVTSIVDPNDPTIIPLAARSDSLWNYEIGAKTQWFDGRAQANVAVYFVVWDDIQLAAGRASDSAPYTTNGGDVESKGLEAEFLVWPSENFQFGLNLTVAESKIVKLSQEDAVISGAVEGSHLASPEFQISGFAQYIWPLNNNSSIYARVDVQHLGDYPNTLPNTAGSPIQAPNPSFSYTSAYENVNAQLGWETANITVVLYAENLLDNDDTVYINPTNFSAHSRGTLRPFTVGLRADWNF